MRLFKFLHFNKACPAKPWRSRGFTPSLENDIAPIKIGAGKSPMSFFSAGFTFIELVMVISIFVIISGVSLFNFGDYSDSISLQNLAHQISLEIVQAQRDAISGRNPTYFGTDAPAYGIAFSNSSIETGIIHRRQFAYFADLGGSLRDGWLDTSEDSSEILITRGNFVSGLDYSQDGTNWDNAGGELFISFKRPYPDAKFVGSNGSALSSPDPSFVRIVIESPKKNNRSIIVSSLGQVSVK